eukprot:TRINITY_DN2649_c0_g1_i5.p1 TRINITY_DN2649_c0_g1~~TRINITY_DN2649_c0_g1_i5.p1  ORF type:complete len:1103 (-),score=482.97 TRINITY_DN2649_c0_g1_i5:137-3445(-)
MLTAEKSALDERLQSASGEVGQLQDQLRSAEKQVEALTTEKSALDERLQAASGEDVQLQDQLRSSEKQVEVLTAEKSAVDERLQRALAASGEVGQLQDQLRSAEKQLESVTAAKAMVKERLQKRVADSEEREKQLNSEVDRFKKDLSSLQAKLKELLFKLKKERTEHENALKAEQARVVELEVARGGVDAALRQKDEELSAARQVAEQQRSELEVALRQREQAATSSQDIAKARAELENALRQKEQELAAGRQALESQRESFEAAAAQSSHQLTLKITELEHEKAVLDDAVAQRELDLKQLRELGDSQRTKLEGLAAKSKTMSAELRKMQADKQAVAARIQALEESSSQALASRDEQLAEAREEARRHASDVEQLRAQLGDVVKAGAAQLEETLRGATDAKEAAEAERRAADQRSQQLSSELAEAQAQLAAARDQLVDAQQQLADARKSAEAQAAQESTVEAAKKEGAQLRALLQKAKKATDQLQADKKAGVAQIEELSAKLAEAEQTIADLRSQSDEHAKASKHITAQLASTDKASGELRAQTEQLLKRVAELEDERTAATRVQEELTAARKSLEEVAAAKTAVDDKLAEALKSLASAKQAGDSETKSMQEKYAKLKNLLAAANNHIQQKTTQLQAAQKQAADSDALSKAAQQEIEGLKRDLDSRMGDDERIRVELENRFSRTRQQYEGKLQDLEMKLVTATQELVQSQEQFRAYKVRAHSAIKQQESQKGKSAEDHEEIIAELRSQLTDVRKKNTDMAQFVTELQKHQANAESKEIELVALQKKNSEMVARFAELQESLQLKEGDWQDKLETLEREKEQLASLASQQSQVVGAVEHEKAIRVEELTAQLKASREHSTKLTQQLDLKADELVGLRAALAQLRRESADNSATRRGSQDASATLSPPSSPEPVPAVASNGWEQQPLRSVSQPTVFSRSPSGSDLARAGLGWSASSSEAHRPAEYRANPDDQLLHFAQIQAHRDQELAAARMKIQQLTDMMRDAEREIKLHVEQELALKEEIKNFERDDKREEHLRNMEYLKNIIVKYMLTDEVEQQQALLPVVATLLQLSPQELTAIKSRAANAAASSGSWLSLGSYFSPQKR